MPFPMFQFILLRMNMLPVVFENGEIIIVNKKCGLAVQGGAGIRFSLDRLLSEQVGYKVYPVHRLDKDTAGLLVLAKTAAAAAVWTNLIASGEVRKEYAALCAGIPPGKKGTFTAPIETKGERKSAVTDYVVCRTAETVFPDAPGLDGVQTVPVSLLRLTLGTGRMHQIRIHLAQAGCPIVADDKYGDFRLNKLFRSGRGIRKLQLAAVKLTIPLAGNKNVFEIDLPEHLRNACGLLFDSAAT